MSGQQQIPYLEERKLIKRWSGPWPMLANMAFTLLIFAVTWWVFQDPRGIMRFYTPYVGYNYCRWWLIILIWMAYIFDFWPFRRDWVRSAHPLQKGLVLVTGPAGAGKSTTLACIIDRLNHERSGHIITMEDPIEYVHKHGTCIVTQREVPTDVATYSEALRSAMRESPDVILLGEMRDQDTIGTAVTAAEMAQLLFSTLHTTGAAGTVDRIIDAFPASQQRQIRIQLSMVLQAIVSQQLVPTVDGGTAPAFEIMITNTAIRNLIREEKTHQLDSAIASGGAEGMRTMDQSLFDLVKSGRVAKEMALQYSIHQEALEKRFETEGL